jgi:hypothetical protein
MAFCALLLHSDSDRSDKNNTETDDDTSATDSDTDSYGYDGVSDKEKFQRLGQMRLGLVGLKIFEERMKRIFLFSIIHGSCGCFSIFIVIYYKSDVWRLKPVVQDAASGGFWYFFVR